MVLTALAVWLESAGPVLYRQERVGENGRIFTLYKFRSMRTDAEKGGTPIWATRRRRPRSRASAASSARRASTSCRSSGTCCAAT